MPETTTVGPTDPTPIDRPREPGEKDPAWRDESPEGADA